MIYEVDFHDTGMNERYQVLVQWSNDMRRQEASLELTVRPEYVTMDRLQQTSKPYAVMESNALFTLKHTICLVDANQFNIDRMILAIAIDFKIMYRAQLHEFVQPGQELTMAAMLKTSSAMGYEAGFKVTGTDIESRHPDTLKLQTLEEAARNLLSSVPGSEYALRSLLDTKPDPQK